MKYLLKNKQTGEKILCDKVTKDGFDYYVSDEKYSENELVYCVANGWLQKARVEHLVEQRGKNNQWRKVIATNNPNISISKVKELLGEVDVEKKVDILKNKFGYSTDDYYQGAEDGYKLALEDNKEKKYTEDDIYKAIQYGREVHYTNDQPFIQSLQPNSNGKLSSLPKEHWGVHARHCCSKHGCKYGDFEECPVMLGNVKQEYRCEYGELDDDCFTSHKEMKPQVGYFFTPEQLNEYTANVIKQALETAAEKAVTKNEWEGNTGSEYYDTVVNRQSITNTFEETFQKHKL